MNTMKDYLDLSLKLDTLLLACVFETFRIKSINSFEVDHASYLYTSGYSWVAIIMFTDVNLRLTSDI